MARVVAQEKKELPLDLGQIYNIKCIKVEEADQKDSKFEAKGPREALHMQFFDEDWQPLLDDEDRPIIGRKFVTIYPDGMRPKQAIYGIFSAFMHGGAEIPKGEECDTEDLVGKKARTLWGMVYDIDGKNGQPGFEKFLPPARQRAAATAGGARRGGVTEEDVDKV